MSRSLAVRPVAERVFNGIEFGDREFDQGWDQGIDLVALNVASCKKCLLGQLFGGFTSALVALDLDDDDAARLGFTVFGNEPPEVYGELTDAWLVALRARRLAVSR